MRPAQIIVKTYVDFSITRFIEKARDLHIKFFDKIRQFYNDIFNSDKKVNLPETICYNEYSDKLRHSILIRGKYG